MTIPLHDRILDSIEAYFALSPAMLALSIEQSGPTADRPPTRISVKAIREALSEGTMPADERDAIWSQLVQFARSGKEHWDLAAAWMMTPGLRKMCGWCRRYAMSTDLAELQAEAVAGFLEALKGADPHEQELESWLWWTTYRHLRRAISYQRLEKPTDKIELMANRSTWQHDDAPSTPGPRLSGRTCSLLVDSEAITQTTVESERLGSLAHRMGLRTALLRTTINSSEQAA